MSANGSAQQVGPLVFVTSIRNWPGTTAARSAGIGYKSGVGLESAMFRPRFTVDCLASVACILLDCSPSNNKEKIEGAKWTSFLHRVQGQAAAAGFLTISFAYSLAKLERAHWPASTRLAPRTRSRFMTTHRWPRKLSTSIRSRFATRDGISAMRRQCP